VHAGDAEGDVDALAFQLCDDGLAAGASVHTSYRTRRPP
jgi:hypothetical protein